MINLLPGQIKENFEKVSSICLKCDLNTKKDIGELGNCGICGCWLIPKGYVGVMGIGNCPINKWDKVL